jgi:subtilisin family serine protease
MRQTRHALLLTLVLATGLVGPGPVTAADPPAAQNQDEILVRYRSGVTAAQRRAVVQKFRLTVVSASKTGRTALVRGQGVSPATVRRQLAADPNVEAVARNYPRELTLDPTGEDFFGEQWGLHNSGQDIDGVEPQIGVVDVDIDGLEAIRVQPGRADIVVAVIDDGVDFSHPDLAARAWDNPDDPGTHGWDFCDDDSDPSPEGDDGHGTHVAGTIAASLDGNGVVGVAPGVTIMALRAFSNSVSCENDAGLADAIDFAAARGVPIINASWGGAGQSDVLDDAIRDSAALFVAASGNEGRDLDAPGPDFYPAETVGDNVLTVGAIDQVGEIAEFSNYGGAAVDIMAPGTNILSTYPAIDGPLPGDDCPAPCYVWANGTSMATPHVSGIAALALSKMTVPPTAAALRTYVLGRGVGLPQTSCLTSTGRLANAYRAVGAPGPATFAPCTWTFDVGSIVGSSISSTLSWQPASGNLSGVRYVVLRRREAGSWTTVATQTGRSIRQPLGFGTAYRYATRTRRSTGSLGPIAYGQYVEPTLFQESTSLAQYSGRWTSTSTSSASGGKMRFASSAGASVEFRRSLMGVAVIGRRGPTSGKAKVYIDGVLASTIDLFRSTAQSRVVLFSRSWTTYAPHTVRVELEGTAGRPRVDIDGFAILR